jgi:hypothetical protein
LKAYKAVNKNLEAWQVKDVDFPQNGHLTQKIEFCVRYAILAHSTYNNQPWYFDIEENTISVFCDRRYALPLNDPDDRQLLMSCAGALYQLRLALRYFGMEEHTQLLPNPNDQELIARVQVTENTYTPGEEEKALFHAMTTRTNNRGVYRKTKVPQDKLDILCDAARSENAWLYICEGDERDIVAHMIAEGDNIQMSNKAFRRELAVWANERRFISGDGLPDYAYGYHDLLNSNKPTVIRRFESTPGEVVTDDKITEGAPVLAILGSNKGGTVNRLYSGQAFARIFLQAEALGLSMSTLNQPCEVAELRLRLHDEIENFHGRAHFVLRIGYADRHVNYSPRRPLDSFIMQTEERTHTQDVLPSKNNILAKFIGLFKRS